jgi:hypothetical protein
MFVADGHGSNTNARVVKFSKDGSLSRPGARRAPDQASSTPCTGWRWIPRAGCLWPIAATTGFRSSIRSIRIGSAKDRSVKYFIPDLPTNPANAPAEGVSADAKDDIFAAGVSSMGLHRLVKSRPVRTHESHGRFRRSPVD